MSGMLDLCRDFPIASLSAGQTILSEGESSGKLFVLADGALEVHRDNVSIALSTEPGAIFGEMSVLLGIPHTASVRAASDAKVHVIEDASTELNQNHRLMVPVAKLLARRLQSATSYLVDLKQQFQDRTDHFGMVDEVLESLSHQQDEDLALAEELPPDPHERT